MNDQILSQMSEALQKNIEYKFKSAELIETAMTHKSYFFENQTKSQSHNEKLEFLGDAVLDLVLSELLMEKFPTDGEGSLSKKRASLVNETVLNEVAVGMSLATYLRLGKGELNSGGQSKPRLLSSAYEALIGALFLDGGFDVAKRIARNHFLPVLAKINPDEDYTADYKTRLQEKVQAILKEAPIYEVVKESGPAHERMFEVQLSVQGKVWANGEGRSKKQAEQMAAKSALDNLHESKLIKGEE